LLARADEVVEQGYATSTWHETDMPMQSPHVRHQGMNRLRSGVARGPLMTDTVEKVFWGWRTKFSGAADAFRAQRCEGPRIASQKNDNRLSYRRYGASQRRSCPKISICEIFGVVRFSTFSTVSTHSRLAVNRFTRLGVPDRFAKLHQIGALPSPLRQSSRGVAAELPIIRSCSVIHGSESHIGFAGPPP
jgi:hypothetical protein